MSEEPNSPAPQTPPSLASTPSDACAPEGDIAATGPQPRGRRGAPGRRTVLGAGAVLTGTALGGVAAARLIGSARSDDGAGRHDTAPAGPKDVLPAAAAWGAQRESFHGPHQAGVLTRQQAHALFLGLDLRPGCGKAKIISLLRMLTDDAARLCSGRPPLGGVETAPIALPGRLTVTVGFGPGLFDAAGIGPRCPAAVRSLPAFATDRFERRWGQTDLLVQVCGDDPMTVSYARRRLLRDADTFTTLRWSQQGFVGARGHEPDTTTPRNLMGMRDGSANEHDPSQQARVVWCDDPAQPWLRGGTQLVLRRIRIDLDRWDDLDSSTKEATFGRRIGSGAPLTGTRESDTLVRDQVDAQGFRVVADNAHAARAQARTAAERMIRRGYNYDDGVLATGEPDAGLLFAAFQADIATAFVPVQRRLAAADTLNEWIRHVGSACYALPPGVPAGGWLGQSVLA